MDSEHEICLRHTCGFYHTLNKSGVIFSYKLAVAYVSLQIPLRGENSVAHCRTQIFTRERTYSPGPGR